MTNVTTLPFGLDNMVFDNRGRLFVSNSDDGHVDRVLPATGSHRQLLKGGLIIPGGVAVQPQATGGDRVVVADLWRVATYNGRTGRLLDLDADFGAFGAVPGVTTTAADGEHVILTSWIAEAVTVWDPAANERVAVYGGFGLPLNAIRFGEDLVVAALGPAPVVRQAPGGAQTPARTWVPCWSRRGLAATADDLWVADWATGTVWQLVKDGVTLAAPAVVTIGLSQPEGLAVDRDGSLLVVEAGAGRLTRIDPATGVRSTVATGLGLGDGRASGCAAHLDVQRRRRWAEGRHLRDGRHRRRHLPVLTRALNHAHTQCPDGAVDPAAPSPISRTQGRAVQRQPSATSAASTSMRGNSGVGASVTRPASGAPPHASSSRTSGPSLPSGPYAQP